VSCSAGATTVSTSTHTGKGTLTGLAQVPAHAGIPDELYNLPESPYVDYMLTDVDPLPGEVLEQLGEPCLCADTDCQAYFTYLCNFHNWSLPSE